MKFDFLGLRTLTIINWALEMINKRRAKNGEPPLDIAAIPLDDKASTCCNARKPRRYSSLNRAA
ncbi:hypothetical protein ACLB1Q_15470 [Escherichia coli]